MKRAKPVCTVAAADEEQGVDGAQQPSVLEGASTGATKLIAAAVECGDRFLDNRIKRS